MQFTMKNVFGLVAVLTIGVSTVTASPTQVTSLSNRARDVIHKMEKYIAAGVNVPAEYKPFDQSGALPQSEVEIVTTQDEAADLSQRHGHKIRIDVANDQLVYVTVPEDSSAPTKHVATLGGALLERTLDEIDFYLDDQERRVLTSTTTPAPGTDLAAQRKTCQRDFCVVTWQCYALDDGCGGCLIFFCMRKDPIPHDPPALE